jgi:prepilin-type N-terminal cleavage/methylation domain-containing protein
MLDLRLERGFTLVELVVAIAIIAIAATIGTISFSSWQTKYKVEAQTREIYNDLNVARTNAFQQKRDHEVVFQPSSYVMKSYSSESDPGKTVLNKTGLKFGLTRKNSGTNALNGDISDYRIRYDTRGYDAEGNFTLVVNPYDVGSAVNCIVISKSRVNLGRINGSTCEFR